MHVVILEQCATLSRPFSLDLVPAARAFSEMLPHAPCFDPGHAAETDRLTRHYLTLVERVPVHRFRYRPSFDTLPEIVAALSALTSASATESAG